MSGTAIDSPSECVRLKDQTNISSIIVLLEAELNLILPNIITEEHIYECRMELNATCMQPYVLSTCYKIGDCKQVFDLLANAKVTAQSLLKYGIDDQLLCTLRHVIGDYIFSTCSPALSTNSCHCVKHKQRTWAVSLDEEKYVIGLEFYEDRKRELQNSSYVMELAQIRNTDAKRVDASFEMAVQSAICEVLIRTNLSSDIIDSAISSAARKFVLHVGFCDIIKRVLDETIPVRKIHSPKWYTQHLDGHGILHKAVSDYLYKFGEYTVSIHVDNKQNDVSIS
jgi:hypothetical protein